MNWVSGPLTRDELLPNGQKGGEEGRILEEKKTGDKRSSVSGKTLTLSIEEANLQRLLKKTPEEMEKGRAPYRTERI